MVSSHVEAVEPEVLCTVPLAPGSLGEGPDGLHVLGTRVLSIDRYVNPEVQHLSFVRVGPDIVDFCGAASGPRPPPNPLEMVGPPFPVGFG